MKDAIVQSEDPVLRHKAKPVAHKEVGSPHLRSIIARMKKALAKEEFGVALAAPQIGESLRIFIIAGKTFDEPGLSKKSLGGGATEPSQEPMRRSRAPVHLSGAEAPARARADMVFINPEITRLSRRKKEMSEGCLSVRGKYGTVMRHEKATVKALDEHGKPFIYHGSGLIGHIFQHECDHLDGILYTDKTVRLEEDSDLGSARKKLREKHNI